VSHLTDCRDCEEALADLDGETDPLVRKLAGLSSVEQITVPPPPASLLEAARGVARGQSPALIDAGRRLEQQLETGSARLGRFELKRCLGSGSFGTVFLAHDTELDREVALKVQRSGALADAHEAERFLREARSAAQLEHADIVSLHETGTTEEGVPFLVCEYIEGETLSDRLTHGALSPAQGAGLVLRVARALAYAHEHGVIHRDVKPSNILLDRRGDPHLADFGLAKREIGEETVTPLGEIMGTPAYMSPELARGDAHHVDARSDVYSLGVVLYEVLTGDRPFHGVRRLLLLQVLEEEPRPPRQLDERIPHDLETICLNALQKAPSQRYASAGAMADDIERYLAESPIQARRSSAIVRLGRWARRQPMAASLISAGVFGSLLGFLHISNLSRDLVRSAALDSVSQYADMLEVVNEFYSSEVVDRVGSHDVEVTAEYARLEGAIPLPATLLTELLARSEDRGSGMHGRHYSKYPYPFRQNGGARDEFERQALAALTADPLDPYYRYTHDEQGAPVLRYARARIMGPSCVACHNGHPQSPRHDWSVGDVRGVLEVVRSLDSDEARIREGLRGTSVLITTSALAMLALGLGAHRLGNRRRRAIVRGGQA